MLFTNNYMSKWWNIYVFVAFCCCGYALREKRSPDSPWLKGLQGLNDFLMQDTSKIQSSRLQENINSAPENDRRKYWPTEIEHGALPPPNWQSEYDYRNLARPYRQESGERPNNYATTGEWRPPSQDRSNWNQNENLPRFQQYPNGNRNQKPPKGRGHGNQPWAGSDWIPPGQRKKQFNPGPSYQPETRPGEGSIYKWEPRFQGQADRGETMNGHRTPTTSVPELATKMRETRVKMPGDVPQINKDYVNQKLPIFSQYSFQVVPVTPES